MPASILIVEHERDIADVLRRYLEFEGFSVACVATITDARVACARRMPDLIVLEWRLPDLTSHEWANELRAQPATAAIPIVMMTGSFPNSALLSRLAAARIPLLLKPFSLDFLVDHIRHAVGKEQALGAT